MWGEIMLGSLVWRFRGSLNWGLEGGVVRSLHVSFGRFPGLGAWGIPWTGGLWGGAVVVPGLEVWGSP